MIFWGFLALSPANADSLILPGFNTHAVDKDEVESDESEKKTTFIPVDDILAVGVTVGVANAPYIGGDTDWTVWPVVSYEGTYAYIRGMTAGLKLINMPYVELSVFLGYDDTELDSAEAEHLLRSRHPGAVMGGEARVYTPIGVFAASASGDISGHSNGLTGSVSYTSSIAFGDLELDPSIGLVWASSKYNDYFYGINDVEAERLDINPYQAGSGAAPFFALTAVYSITEHWGVFFDGQFRYLEHAVKDSPLVNRTNIYSAVTGVFYAF
ncbi:MipA/OmpV family protein [Desulfovibrio sp. OttesenSCG-928-F20]|nr:MipA/OmpV family protein [Desulfovibrio sp. OttesenSCG-928-F20]